MKSINICNNKEKTNQMTNTYIEQILPRPSTSLTKKKKFLSPVLKKDKLFYLKAIINFSRLFNQIIVSFKEPELLAFSWIIPLQKKGSKHQYKKFKKFN